MRNKESMRIKARVARSKNQARPTMWKTGRVSPPILLAWFSIKMKKDKGHETRCIVLNEEEGEMKRNAVSQDKQVYLLPTFVLSTARPRVIANRQRMVRSPVFPLKIQNRHLQEILQIR